MIGTVSTALADTYYVSDAFQVTMRTGPAVDRKIVKILSSGQPLEMVEKGDEWSQIRLPDGQEGWALTRFLTSSTPARLRLEALQRRFDALKERAAKGDTQASTLAEENKSLQTQLTQTTKQLEATTADYDSLRQASADVLKIKSDRDRLATQTAAQSDRIARLESDLSAARSKRNLYWFLGGAGVFVVGLGFGLALRSKRRRPTLY